LALLAEKCGTEQLATMRAALRNVSDEAFRYDISYIQENMGWSDAGLAASGATAGGGNASSSGGGAGNGSGGNGGNARPVSAASHALVATRSCTGHTNTIFALGYDPKFDFFISSGKDAQVISWSPAGVPYQV
jgi:hypothetical protein